jgi:hypothetical protein
MPPAYGGLSMSTRKVKKRKPAKVTKVAKPKAGAVRGPSRKGVGRKPYKLPPDLAKLDRLVSVIQPELPPVASKRVAVIRQNAILSRMERRWNKASPRGREALLRQLIALRALDGQQQIAALIEQGKQDGTLRDEADIQHAANDWLGTYFRGPVAQTLIDAMIVAGQRSLARGVPVAMYWVASSGSELKVSVAQSDHQVTFLLMTPPDPAGHTQVRQLDKAEPLWVISGRDSQAEVEQVYATALVVQ